MTEPPVSRSIDLSVVVPGTPEEVWDAIATGPGITSWFVASEVEPREGGTVVSDFGSMGKEVSTVTAYEAPHRFAAETNHDGKTTAVEWLVEARDRGTCVVRLVHSGFGHGPEWDDSVDGMTNGWKMFLENLRLHRTHFPGGHGQAIVPMKQIAGPHEEAWRTLCAELGIAPTLGEGEAFATSASKAPALSGIVARAQRTPAISNYIVVLDGATRGTAIIAIEGAGDSVMASLWLYVYDADATLDSRAQEFVDSLTVDGARTPG